MIVAEEVEPTENGNGNGHAPQRRLSGFASPDYWDGIDPDTGLTRREAKRAWAKKANEEGRFGGRQPGAGRPRSKTVAEIVTEEAQRDAPLIYRRLKEMLSNRSPSVQLGAIDRIASMEQSVQKNMRDDEKELLKLSGKQLDAAMAEAFTELGIPYDIDLGPNDVEELPDGD